VYFLLLAFRRHQLSTGRIGFVRAIMSSVKLPYSVGDAETNAKLHDDVEIGTVADDTSSSQRCSLVPTKSSSTTTFRRTNGIELEPEETDSHQQINTRTSSTIPSRIQTTEIFRKRRKRRNGFQSGDVKPTVLSAPLGLTSYFGLSSTFTTADSSSAKAVATLFLHPTVSLPLLVFVDMLGVSLVIPLLFQYYQRAGLRSANQRELLSSIFSFAQIVGGLLMGVLTDGGKVQRRTLLLLSFGGSAISYALIVYGGFTALIISRILVGLVKQTMTVTTAILTRATVSNDRAKYLGRMTAASTVAWIIGPSIGALLFKYVDYRAPALAASFLFMIAVLLTLILVKDDAYMEQFVVNEHNPVSPVKNHESDDEDTRSMTLNSKEDGKITLNIRHQEGFDTIIGNLKSCFSSKILGATVLTKLVITWVGQATNYGSLGSFYEDMYDLEPHHRGYIASYQQALQFISQSMLVGFLLRVSGGERRTTCLFTGLLSLAVGLEVLRSLSLFICILCPMISICFSMINLSLQTLVTQVAPIDATFSVLAALDVLQNIAQVSVPFYRTTLFHLLGKNKNIDSFKKSTTTMEGDPDPVSWILSSSVHWICATVLVTYLLLFRNTSEWEQSEKECQRQSKVSGKKGR
jgi:MFS family permease